MDEIYWAMEDDLKDDWSWVENEYSHLETDFENNLPDWDEWNDETWSERHHNSSFRWFIRFLFTGIPWLIIDTIYQLINIGENVVGNKMWAGGNLFLMFNTAVSLF